MVISYTQLINVPWSFPQVLELCYNELGSTSDLCTCSLKLLHLGLAYNKLSTLDLEPSNWSVGGHTAWSVGGHTAWSVGGHCLVSRGPYCLVSRGPYYLVSRGPYCLVSRGPYCLVSRGPYCLVFREAYCLVFRGPYYLVFMGSYYLVFRGPYWGPVSRVLSVWRGPMDAMHLAAFRFLHVAMEMC